MVYFFIAYMVGEMSAYVNDSSVLVIGPIHESSKHHQKCQYPSSL